MWVSLSKYSRRSVFLTLFPPLSHQQRSMCVSKRETCMQKIQELGSLPPPSELEKFFSYRAAVANLIQRQANCEDNPTQFIVSTFRPELVAVANRCYGISHQNKVSSLHPLSKKDALHFIANLMNEEEAVGEVTSLATSKATRLTLESRKRKSVRSIAETDDEDDADDDAAEGVDEDEGEEGVDDMAEDLIASETSP
jgi:hypothetical protein